MTSEHDAPMLGGQCISVLLFADDTLLISKTQRGLWILLDKFNQFCIQNSLALNPEKTKYTIINPGKKSLGLLNVVADTIDEIAEFD